MNKPTHQPSLFPQKAIPQMPAGYYTPGPNPNLRQFIADHATPYDPAGDDYRVPPFDQPITTTKATAIYNMHTYWSKKPHDAIRQYIRHPAGRRGAGPLLRLWRHGAGGADGRTHGRGH